jgi:hypothetical protein
LMSAQARATGVSVILTFKTGNATMGDSGSLTLSMGSAFCGIGCF